jgi:DNA uptake protein ComE-like DNA-binding protein
VRIARPDTEERRIELHDKATAGRRRSVTAPAAGGPVAGLTGPPRGDRGGPDGSGGESPDRGKAAGRTETGADPLSTGRRIGVKTATGAKLEALPGVGPVIARRIIQDRPHRSVDDLDRVQGIGKRRLDEIRSLVAAE